MLENIRKYTVLMVITLVLCFIGLVFMESGSFNNPFGGPAAFEADGKKYTLDDYNKLGQNGVRLSRNLGLDGQQYFTALASEIDERGEPNAANFAIKRLHVRELASKLGIHPSKETIENYIKTKSVFAPNGEFNSALYDSFIKNRLPNYGMSVADFNEFVGEIISFKKASEVLGSGITLDRNILDDMLDRNFQEITFRLFEYQRATQEGKIQPTEEEVKAYWELNQGNYKTQPQAKLTYIHSTTPLPTKPTAPENGEETDQEKAARDAALATFQTQKEEAIQEMTNRFDILWEQVDDLDGNSFEQLAKDNEFTTTTTELFPLNQIPTEINKPINDATGKTLAQAIQEALPDTSTMDSISDVFILNDSEFLLFRLDAFQPADVQSYDQAKAAARLDLINSKAAGAMTAAAEKAHADLQKLLTEGTALEDALKQLNLEEPKKFDNITVRDQPAGLANPQSVFQTASIVNSGQLSKVVSQTNENQFASPRAFFVYVDQRIVRDSERNQSFKEMNADQANSILPLFITQDWLSERYAISGANTGN